MTLQCAKGGAGMRDFNCMNKSTLVEKTRWLWTWSNVWVDWMNRSYIRGSLLASINCCYNDSSHWMAILRARPETEKCMDCQSNWRYNWKDKGATTSLITINETILNCQPKDIDANGIWSSSLPKASLLLCRLRWGHLPTTDWILKREATKNRYAHYVMTKMNWSKICSLLAIFRNNFHRKVWGQSQRQ